MAPPATADDAASDSRSHGLGNVDSAFPTFSKRLAALASACRLPARGGNIADVEAFTRELGAYVFELRRAFISRDRVKAAVWPLLVGIESQDLVIGTVAWCLAEYDRAARASGLR